MRKSEITVSVAGVVVILGAIFMFSTLIASSIDKISSANFDNRMKQLENKQREVNELKASYEEWKNAKSSLKEFRKNEVLHFRKFPSFSGTLRSLLNESGLQLESIENRISSTKSYDFVKVIVTLQLRGFYPGYKSFVDRLGTLDTIVTLRRMELKKSDTGVEGKIKLEVCFDRRS